MDSGKCSGMLNKGLYKNYKFHGIGEANAKAVTGETKSAGSSSASKNITTEGTTATVDPKYSSNVTRSESQSTSSTGDCSLFALKERSEYREQYLVQNQEQIELEISMGRGSHLEDLAWLSLCDDGISSEFSKTLQSNFDRWQQGSAKRSATLDQILSENPRLATGCFNFSKI